jgi:hypothetical protein
MSPARPLALRLCADGEEVARGLANRFRADLMEASIGVGWCAFRFRAIGSIGRLRRSTLSLAELPGNIPLVVETGTPKLVEDTDLPLTVLDEIARSDPTQITSIEQLRGCSEIFTTLIEAAGVEAFIRAAYIYALGRPADPTGLKLYGGLIGGGELSPFGLLQALCDGDEFRAVARILIAPTEPGFIFSAL